MVFQSDGRWRASGSDTLLRDVLVAEERYRGLWPEVGGFVPAVGVGSQDCFNTPLMRDRPSIPRRSHCGRRRRGRRRPRPRAQPGLAPGLIDPGAFSGPPSGGRGTRQRATAVANRGIRTIGLRPSRCSRSTRACGMMPVRPIVWRHREPPIQINRSAVGRARTSRGSDRILATLDEVLFLQLTQPLQPGAPGRARAQRHRSRPHGVHLQEQRSLWGDFRHRTIPDARDDSGSQ